jgi:anti-anti-sigma factor
VDFDCRIEREHLVVEGNGELGSRNMRMLWHLIEDRAKRTGLRRVVINASFLSGLDAISIGALIMLARSLSEQGGYLRIARLHSGVRPTFEHLSLHELLPCYSSLELALS